MSVSPSPFEPVVLETPTLRVELLPFGLTVQSIQVGGQHVLPSYADPRSHGPPNRAFFAPIVGRYANRLPSGDVPYGRNGQHVAHLLEWSAKGISHHGGPASTPSAVENLHPSGTAGTGTPWPLLQHGPFDQCIWSLIELSDAQLIRHGTGTETDVPAHTAASAVFALESPDGDQGYPGHLRVEVLVALTAPSGRAVGRAGTGNSDGDEAPVPTSQGSVHLVYRAKILDAGTAATPLNLTHHWGFNLSAGSTLPGAVRENGTIDAHQLEILAPLAPPVQRLATDAQGLPTGQLLPIVQGDAHDFSHGGKVMGDNMPEGGYDHYYFWGPRGEKEAETGALAERVRLSATSTGMAVVFATDQPGMQVYSTNGQPAYPASAAATGGARTLALNHGADVARAATLGNHARCAAMLEFGAPHATFLHPALAAAAGTDTILTRGDVYKAHTAAEFFK